MAENRDLYSTRVSVNPDIAVGKPTITGTRIPVQLVLSKLAHSWNVEELLDDYPSMTIDDIRACIAYAADAVAGEEVMLFREDDALATA
jgi:uncharacterized protein (DUF433 family)